MGKKKILIGSILAVALLILVSFSNVVGYNTVKTSQEELIESKYSFDECKEYLFQTIIEISDNPEIQDIVKSNYKPQRTILPFRSNNVDLKVEHLELLYELGLKIIDRLGEERVEDLMENIEIPDNAYEIESIIMGNDELRERIYTLNTMNVKSETVDWEYPIICGISRIFIFISEFMLSLYITIAEILFFFTFLSHILSIILIPIGYLTLSMLVISREIFTYFKCWNTSNLTFN